MGTDDVGGEGGGEGGDGMRLGGVPVFGVTDIQKTDIINSMDSDRTYLKGTARRKEKSKVRRTVRRKNKPPTAKQIKPSLARKHADLKAQRMEFNAHELPANKRCYTGAAQPQKKPHIPTIDELRKEGFNVIQWDGW